MFDIIYNHFTLTIRIQVVCTPYSLKYSIPFSTHLPIKVLLLRVDPLLRTPHNNIIHNLARKEYRVLTFLCRLVEGLREYRMTSACFLQYLY